MTYAEQLEIIKAIPVREGESKVIQCPFCYGLKKLALSKFDGKIMWNCYRASCNGKGIYSGKRSAEAVKNYLEDTVSIRRSKHRPMPTVTASVYNHPECINFLELCNSLDAYERGYVKVKYAPAEDRVLFCATNGAVGRLLSGSGPKWISYGELPSGIHVGIGSTAVLVEDVPSACSVSRIEGMVGVALLGTTITAGIKSTLSEYNNCYLVLDKDASVKSLKQSKSISHNIKVRFTSEDLKYLTTDKIQDLIHIS
jgi:hypothetical protein